MRAAVLVRLRTGLRRRAASLFVGATLAWMGLTLVLLATPAPPSPPGTPLFPWLPLDLVVHLGLFTVLGVLASVSAVLLVSRDKPGTGVLLAFLGAVAWGGFTELLQLGMPQRSASLEDFLADFAGALAGAVIVGAVRRRWGGRPAPDRPPHGT